MTPREPDVERTPGPTAPTAKIASHVVYERLERKVVLMAPASAVPSWWVPLVLATMARRHCNPADAADAIDTEQTVAGCPLDAAGRAALREAVAAIEKVWP